MPGIVPLVKDCVTVAAPASLAMLLVFVNQTLTMAFVSRFLGVHAVAEFAIAQGLFNVMTQSICLSLASALDTLVSQAYGRDPRSPDITVLLQRSILVVLCTYVPLALVLAAFAHPLMTRLFGPDLADGAAVWLRVSPLYGVLNLVSVCCHKALLATRRPGIPTVGYAAALVTCPIANWILTPRLGIAGGVLSMTLCAFVRVTTMVLVGRRVDGSAFTLASWHPTAVARVWSDLPQLKRFLAVGLPNVALGCAKWWGFEILNVVAGTLGATAVGSYSIAFNLHILIYAPVSGIAQGTAALVGNALGGNNPKLAIAAARVCGSLAVGVSLCTATALQFVHGGVFRLYTDDAASLALLASAAPVMGCFLVLNAVTTVGLNVSRGAGKTGDTAKISLVTMWGVALPLAYLLSRKFGVAGIFGGSCVGFVLEALAIAWVVRRWNWPALAKAAALGRATKAASTPAAPTPPPSRGVTPAPVRNLSLTTPPSVTVGRGSWGSTPVTAGTGHFHLHHPHPRRRRCYTRCRRPSQPRQMACRASPLDPAARVIHRTTAQRLCACSPGGAAFALKCQSVAIVNLVAYLLRMHICSSSEMTCFVVVWPIVADLRSRRL